MNQQIESLSFSVQKLLLSLKHTIMNQPSEPLTFTVSLTLEAHAKAKQFQMQAANPQKAKQVYLNTLAVYAVNFYLQCQGVETEWEKSDSVNPAMQTLMNVADLQVKNLGKIECRVVLPNSETCYIPPEVWQERIGYIAVQLDESLRSATLLGFVEKVATSELPVSLFKSLEELPEYIEKVSPQPTVPEQVQLSQWLNNVFDTSWQMLETLLNPQPNQLGFRSVFNLKFNRLAFRSVVPTSEITSEESDFKIQRAKLLHLERVDKQVVLCVGIKPTRSSEMQIFVRLYPASERAFLPENLKLTVLDEDGKSVMQAEARSTKSIILKFGVEVGEGFGIKIALGDVSITENFLI
jgi:Protein of unknown function (DUF1822)